MDTLILNLDRAFSHTVLSQPSSLHVVRNMIWPEVNTMLKALKGHFSAIPCPREVWLACVLATLSFSALWPQIQNPPVRVIAFGAHPDDCDLGAGGLAAKYAALGDKVKFVSLNNGAAVQKQWKLGDASVSNTRCSIITTVSSCLPWRFANKSSAKFASGGRTLSSHPGPMITILIIGIRECWCRMHLIW